MRRSIIASGLLAALIFGLTSPALAISMTLSPSSQNRNNGATASWSASWGFYAPFDVHFSYGDGADATWMLGTNLTAKNWSHKFYTCNDMTFTQELYVAERTKSNGLITSRTVVDGGNPC